jgi:hypothetical protein
VVTRLWEPIGHFPAGFRTQYSAALGDPGPCPAAGGPAEHLGQLAFRERVASLDAQAVSGHRLAVKGLYLGYRLVVVLACCSARAPAWPSYGPLGLMWFLARIPAVRSSTGR